MKHMKKDDQHSKRTIIINISIVLVLLIIFFVSLVSKHEIIYTMNDDIALKAIVSGRYTGEPSFYMIFSGFPYSILLVLLYKITNAVDWYGLVLVVSMMFFLGYTIYNIIKNKEDILKKVIYTILIFTVVVIVFNTFLVELTFTSVSAFIATCCLILYLLPDAKMKNIIMTIGIALSFGIRMKSCLMVLVFFVPALFYKNYKDKEKLKKDIILGLKVGLVLIICFIVEKSFYNNSEWKEYLEYNESRSLYYDYYYGAFVNYPIENSIEMYKKAGLDEAEMNLLHTYGGIAFYDDIQPKMGKLIELCKQDIKINSDIKQTIKEMIKNTDNIYYIITLILIAITIIVSSNKKEKIITILPFILLQIALLAYLAIGGRIPERVLVPLYTCYIVTNIYIILQEKNLKNSLNKILNYGKWLVLILVISAFFISINITMESVSTPFGTNADMMETYFKEHSENFYIYDNNELERFKPFKEYSVNNYINMSGWTVYSPLHKQVIKNQGASSFKELLFRDNVYMVLYSQSSIDSYQALEPDAKIEQVDTIGVFNVYKFTK